MILVANKVDLVHLRKVSEEQGKELAKTLAVSHFSLLTFRGIRDLEGWGL